MTGSSRPSANVLRVSFCIVLLCPFLLAFAMILLSMQGR